MTRSAIATEGETSGSAGGQQRALGMWEAIRARFNGPTASFHIVLGITVLLVAVGLIMVQSSSSVRAYAETSSPFYFLIRQAILVFVGAIGFYVALRMRFETLKKLVPWFLGISVLLLVAVLVPGVGSEVNGSRGWIQLGGFAIQPAEIGRLAVILWVAMVLAPRLRSATIKDYFWPAALGPVLIGGLVLVAPDMGMATSIAIAYLVLIFLAGFPWKPLMVFLGSSVVVFIVFASTQAYRMSRVQVYLNTLQGNFDRTGTDGYQTYQGMLSLAEGGLFGQGLGQSSAKWFYLPEASNDFIFAIIGEELGWVGAAFVVGLYIALAAVGVRIAMRSVDPFRRLVAGTVATTISIQAFINIGYVVGLLPVTGIQLPLISYGGSSAVVTLTSLGLLANCARHEPEAISDYRARAAGRRHFWSLPAPQPYTPGPLVKPSGKPGRSSSGGKRYGEPVQSPKARYESAPVVREGQRSRAMTGRTTHAAREEMRRRGAGAQGPAAQGQTPQRRSPQGPGAAGAAASRRGAPEQGRGAGTQGARRGQLRSVPSAEPRPSREARERLSGQQGRQEARRQDVRGSGTTGYPQYTQRRGAGRPGGADRVNGTDRQQRRSRGTS
ncbi:putative lipid II flippase FtsW [Dietzia sp.]|uniref:putative lipid II flippase FtsW n=1 Tax=Dietzia sp. TaxID=1871616 RepID=UPI002FD8A17E